MSDLIARLAARATGAPVATPTAPRSLRGVEEAAHETAADEGPVRLDPTAVNRRNSDEEDGDLATTAGATPDAGTVVAARPRLPRMTDTSDPAVRDEEAPTSDRPSVPQAAGTADGGRRRAVGVRSEIDPRRSLDPPADAGAGAPLAVTGTPPTEQEHTALATEHDADRDTDPLPHVALARPRSDPSHPVAIAEPESEPIVRVHIERLEVRTAPEPTRRSDRRATAPTPAVSLSEYLRGRREAT